jgi:hypothetical protein
MFTVMVPPLELPVIVGSAGTLLGALGDPPHDPATDAIDRSVTA